MSNNNKPKRRLTRRRFLIGTVAVAGGGLVLAWLPGGKRARIDANPSTLEPNAWLQLRANGEIVVQLDRLEMGQGVTTGYVTLIAEELGVSPAAITTRTAPVHPLFQDPSQTTAESQSMRKRWEPLREVGAAAREMLVLAAAERWGVDSADIEVPGDATLVNRNGGASLRYADVAEAAARLPIPGKVELKSADAYRFIGAALERRDIPDKVIGATRYGFDVQLPGQLTAVVVRCPTVGGELLSFDASAALATSGVRDVFRISSGVAILADGFWQAQQGAQSLEIEWLAAEASSWTTQAVHERQRAIVQSGELVEARGDDEFEASFANAARVLESEYALPYFAHATMEPMSATVRVDAAHCDIWTATQSPDLTREVVAGLTGLPRASVDVHVLSAGCSFGRRFMNDFVAEAVEIAQRSDAPVKLLWSREDDIRHDYYHSANLHVLRAALDAHDRPVAWEHQLVAPTMNQYIMPTIMASVSPEWVPDAVHQTLSDWMIAGFEKFMGPFQAYDGATTLPYTVGPVRVGVQSFNVDVPAGIWRSVGNHFNAFAVESFIDELAHAAGEDPVAFRNSRLGNSPRHRAVIERLVRESAWGNPLEGRYQGVAVHGAYESVVGQVAEISIDGNKVRVHRVTCVVDCGVAINPDIVRQQMEGGIIFGMTAALYDEIEFADGAVRQSNFHDYRMVRMAAAPEINVHIIDSDASPGGVGEAGVPPIGPAIANAVFAATGRRIRRLPIRI
jgi:isoquinoline 1-oxidoreductase beta subunit